MVYSRGQYGVSYHTVLCTRHGRFRTIRSERTNPEGDRREPSPKARELILLFLFVFNMFLAPLPPQEGGGEGCQGCQRASVLTNDKRQQASMLACRLLSFVKVKRTTITVLLLLLLLLLFFLLLFLFNIFKSYLHYWRSPRLKNFIASDCSVIVVHMTIKTS